MLLILHMLSPCLLFFFFFNDTATTEIYTLSLHDALPIFRRVPRVAVAAEDPRCRVLRPAPASVDPELDALRRRVLGRRDRKSTRLNSSHLVISYAVFCLKKKKKNTHASYSVHRVCL